MHPPPPYISAPSQLPPFPHRRTIPSFTSVPPHLLLKIVYMTFPQSPAPGEGRPERQRKTLYWLSVGLRLVNRAFYIGEFTVLAVRPIQTYFEKHPRCRFLYISQRVSHLWRFSFPTIIFCHRQSLNGYCCSSSSMYACPALNLSPRLRLPHTPTLLIRSLPPRLCRRHRLQPTASHPTRNTSSRSLHRAQGPRGRLDGRLGTAPRA